MRLSAIGDRLNLDESIMLDCRFAERGRVQSLLQDAGVVVRRCHFYNRGLFAKGLIIHVQRHQGDAAVDVLAANGYRFKD